MLALDLRLASRARGVILFAAAVTAGFSLTTDGNFVTGVLLALVGSLYVLLTVFHLADADERSPYHTLAAVGDAILISAIIALTGGISSEYYLLYLALVLVAALRRDARAGVAACVTCAALYSAVSLVAPIETPVVPFRVIRVSAVCVTATVFTLFFVLLKHQAKLCDDLRGSLHHSLRRVAGVYEVAHAANTGADLHRVLSIVLDHAARGTNATSGTVYLLVDRELRGMASLPAAPGGTAQASESETESARQALESRAPVIVRRAHEDEASGSALHIPLFTPGGSLGVLSLASHQGGGFTGDQLDFLMSLCSEAALAIENAQLHQELERLAVTDHLTGLLNRREVERRLALELERATRHHRPLSLMMVDTDNLKAMNDQYGHAVGDKVLIAVARAIQNNVRGSEVAGRLGGDEFAIVLPETDPRQAAILADRLIESLNTTLRASPDLPDAEAIAAAVGITVGIAGNEDGTLSERELKAHADAALYEAKRAGKNRAWLWPRQPHLIRLPATGRALKS